MKTLLLLFTLMVPGKDLLFYRELLVRSEKSGEAAQLFFERSATLDPQDATMAGYRAMSFMMMSKHADGPMRKLSYFREGKTRLEAAITRAPGNIELLYLRFSVQSNLPAFLGYNSSVEEDKQKLLSYLKMKQAPDADLWKRIYQFLLASEKLSEAEKRSFLPVP